MKKEVLGGICGFLVGALILSGLWMLAFNLPIAIDTSEGNTQSNESSGLLDYDNEFFQYWMLHNLVSNGWQSSSSATGNWDSSLDW